MGVIFWVAKISNIIGVLEIPDIFLGVNCRCWARAEPTYEVEKNDSTPPRGTERDFFFWGGGGCSKF